MKKLLVQYFKKSTQIENSIAPALFSTTASVAGIKKWWLEPV